MSKLIEILNKWMDSIEGDEASILDITITTVNSLEKFKAKAEPRLAKLDALEVMNVDEHRLIRCFDDLQGFTL